MCGVLLLDAHLKQALVVARSLGGRGIPVTAGSHYRWTPSRFSKHAEGWLHYPDLEVSEAFLEAIESELTAGDYDMLLPIEESTLDVVLGNRETFEALTTLSFPPTETTAVGLDKRRTIEAARRHDVPHPETVFSDSTTVTEVESTLSYPIVIKPINGEGRHGVSVCHSRETLRRAARETIAELGPVLFQEFIPNGGECGVYALYDHLSDLRAVTVQRRLRSKPPEGGASTYRETIDDPALVSLADEFLSALDWQGVVMAEFRVDPRSGEPQLMEINPRFWGSLALSVSTSRLCCIVYRPAVNSPRSFRIAVTSRLAVCSPISSNYFSGRTRRGPSESFSPRHRNPAVSI